MTHLKPITRTPMPAQSTGRMSPLETVILVVFAAIFRDWDNFIPVVQGLNKFYQKTP